MALPETVEVVFTPSDPVLATVLNKIQEAIAGDLHPSRSIVLPAAAWQAKPAVGRGATGTPPTRLTDRSWAWGGAAPSIVACALEVPEGHELESVTWYYTRGGAGTPTHAIWSRNLATGGGEVAVSGPTNIAAGAAWATVVDSPAAIIAADFGYELEFNLTNAAHEFGGAKVTYRKLP